VISYDKRIPPGGEGKIRLKVRTKGYSGYHRWSARVISNDPSHKEIRLYIKANIFNPIIIRPRYVRLYAMEGDRVKAKIKISANLKEPLRLKVKDFDLADKISLNIKETKKGREYELYFENSLIKPGIYRGRLLLSTNYKERPQIQIPVFLRIRSQKRILYPK